MEVRETLQDALRAMGFPGKAHHRPPCCRRSMPSFSIVKLTEEEAERFDGAEYACGACLAGPPAMAVAILDPDTPWGDNEIANGVRALRMQRLTACDWTQVTDAPLSADLQVAWRDYRQALRDLPETFSSPLDVEWPTPPA